MSTDWNGNDMKSEKTEVHSGFGLNISGGNSRTESEPCMKLHPLTPAIPAHPPLGDSWTYPATQRSEKQ